MSSGKGVNHSERTQTSNFFSENKKDYYIDRCDIRICLLFFFTYKCVSLRKIVEITAKNRSKSVKFKVFMKHFQTKRLFINNFFVFSQRTNIALFIVVEVRRVLS